MYRNINENIKSESEIAKLGYICKTINIKSHLTRTDTIHVQDAREKMAQSTYSVYGIWVGGQGGDP